MSKIEWTGETWNPIIGCDKVSPGCKNCYAIRTAWIRMHNPKMAERYAGTVEKKEGGQLNWTGKINIVDEVLLKPLKTKKPTTFFVNSMSDLFHKDVPFEFIDKVFAVMALCPQHTFQVLTKRPERMLEYFNSPSRESDIWRCSRINELRLLSGTRFSTTFTWPLPNVWLLASVENKQTADERIPFLLQVPAVVHGLSCEPLLSEVDLHRKMGAYSPGNDTPLRSRGLNKIDWVIVGGESGPGARPMHPDWARDLRDQCKAAGVPFFFKQWGEWCEQSPLSNNKFLWVYKDGFASETQAVREYEKGAFMQKLGKKAAGRLLDGIEYNELPNINP